MELIWNKVVSSAAKVFVSLNKFESVLMPEQFTVTCHAGAMLTPANSLISVRSAVAWGADIVEFDVSFRPDGTPVIIHNSEPNNNQGVFLENALETVAQSDKCKINLDLKSRQNIPAIDDLVNNYGLTERVFYTGVFEDWVKDVRSNSAIPYYLNYKITSKDASDKASAQAVANKTKELGAIGINSNYKNASRLFVDTAQENGLLVSLWTVNKPKDMIEVLKLQPDNITTKKPNILKLLTR